jgi:hypothetical protein
VTSAEQFPSRNLSEDDHPLRAFLPISDIWRQRRSGLLARVMLLLAVALPTTCLAAERDSSYTLALESITAANLRSHVEFLADDRQEGREAGSRGGRACGDYLAKRFAEHKLEPAGNEGFFQPFPFRSRNVLGQLRGSDPRLQFEIIVVGAHYDHVGRGTSRNSRGQVGEIHNGADDNASGTAALVELTQAFSLLVTPPRRTVLFVAWDAEEKGLLGSRYWVAHPTVALDNVVFTANMDMIGRMRDDTVLVLGTRSGMGLRRLAAEHNEGLTMLFNWTTGPNADYWPLFDRRVPYLLLHTGRHDQYHTQDDDARLINPAGIRRLARFMFATIYDVANAERTPTFRAAARHENEAMRLALDAPQAEPVVRLGVGWREPSATAEGVQLTSVDVGSPAGAARLRPGDRLVEVGGRTIHTGDELRWAVFHAAGPTEMVVRRLGESEPRKITAELPEQPLRVGLAWRVDPAAPGTVVLTRVAPGSPAAEAGLRAGDYVYQIAGKDFADEREFAERLERANGSFELLIDRQGRLETIVVHFDAPPVKRAA